MVYARDTNVSVNRTREEIIVTLERYGADAFGYAQDGIQQVVFFRMEGRRVRLLVEMPDPEEFSLTPTGIKRAPEAQRRQWEQACRQRWRAMLLLIKRSPIAPDGCRPCCRCCRRGGLTDGATTRTRRPGRHGQAGRRLLLPTVRPFLRRRTMPSLPARTRDRGAERGVRR